MSDKMISGKITFIHHDKNRAVIEYLDNGKKKTIQADIGEAREKPATQKAIKQSHRFLIGDHVTFQIKKTGANGKIQYTDNVQYQYNTALEILINKSRIENKFLGYIKITDEEYFIKEIETYLFFPLKISPFEIAPKEEEIESPVSFKLENIDKPDKIIAALYNHHYIPEFLIAVQHLKKQTVTDATVYKITPFGIHLNLVNNKLQSKLGIDDLMAEKIASNAIRINTVMPVKIKHISPSKIVVERVVEN